MGLDSRNLVRIKTDNLGRMDINDLRNSLDKCSIENKKIFAIVATLGTTVRGAIDPIKEISEICKRRSIWLHIDGSIGGIFAMTSIPIEGLNNINQANSITINPQKIIGITKPSSLLLVSNMSTLENTFNTGLPYISSKEKIINRGEIGIQGSRPAEVIKLWLGLRFLGLNGIENILKSSIKRKDYFIKNISKNKFDIYSGPLHIVSFLPNKLEPIEEITMDLDEEHSSKIIDSMNRRKGKLIELKDTGKNKKRLIFHAPTRGLMGYTSRFLTLTKGNGVINRIFHAYGPFEGEMEGRRNGALISMEQGKAVAFAIFNLQARGEMFVTHNDPVYPGMIVGLSPKPGDMIINVMKGKKLTNMRTQGTDENVVLTPVRKMSIAEQLSMLNTDEALEITPDSCRLRKAILDPHERKRSEKSGAAA